MWATSEMPQARKRPADSSAPATWARASGASTPHTWLTFTPTFSNTSPRISRDSPPPCRRWPAGFCQLRGAKRLVGSKASNAAQKRACSSRNKAVAVAAQSPAAVSAGGVASGVLMHEVHEARHGVRVGVRPDAVPEIEDVPGLLARLRQHRRGLALELRRGCEQSRRIEVPLHRLAGPEEPAHLRERRTPVDAHDVHVEARHRAHE